MSSSRVLSSSLLAACLLVCVSFLCTTPLTGATFTLSNWRGPINETQLTYATATAPSAVAFNGKVSLAYSSGTPTTAGYLYYTTSATNDGKTFSSTIQTLSNYRTMYDPELVTVYDVGTKQEALLLLLGGTSNQLQYAVYNSATGTWPTSPSTVSGINNVGGDLSALAIVTNTSSGNPSLLCVLYVQYGSGTTYKNGLVATGQLNNGVLSLTSGGLGDGIQWQSGSEVAVFFVPPYGLGFMQMGTGTAFTFSSQTPTVSTSFTFQPNVAYGGIGINQPYSGFSGVQFPLAAACTDLIGIFYIPPSGGLGYVILAPNNASLPLVGGTPSKVTAVTDSSIYQPIVAYLPSAQTLYVYFIDTTNPSVPQINVVYTQPTLV